MFKKNLDEDWEDNPDNDGDDNTDAEDDGVEVDED